MIDVLKMEVGSREFKRRRVIQREVNNKTWSELIKKQETR